MAEEENIKSRATQKPQQRGTSIAVSVSTLSEVNKYCQKYGIAKKDFVELALQWVNEYDIDLTSEVMYKPIKADESDTSKIDALCDLMQRFVSTAMEQQQQTNQMALEATSDARRQNEKLTEELERLMRWKAQAKAELKRIEQNQPYIGRIKVRTDFD